MGNEKQAQPSRSKRVIGIVLRLVLPVLCVIGCVNCVRCLKGDVIGIAVFNDPDSGRSVVFTQEDSFFDVLGRWPFGPCHTRLTLQDEQGKKQDTVLFWLYSDGANAHEDYIHDIAWDGAGVTVTVWDEQGEHEYRLENRK